MHNDRLGTVSRELGYRALHLSKRTASWPPRTESRCRCGKDELPWSGTWEACCPEPRAPRRLASGPAVWRRLVVADCKF